MAHFTKKQIDTLRSYINKFKEGGGITRRIVLRGAPYETRPHVTEDTFIAENSDRLPRRVIFHEPAFGNDTLYFENAAAQKAAFDKYGYGVYSNPNMVKEYSSSSEDAKEEYERMLRVLEFRQEAKRAAEERRAKIGYRPLNGGYLR